MSGEDDSNSELRVHVPRSLCVISCDSCCAIKGGVTDSDWKSILIGPALGLNREA
jgi:hypothetical protein